MTDATTFDARVYQTEVYKGRQVTTYWVRWRVSGRLWKEPFRTVAQAVSFRSSLLTAARKGEAFSVASGRPVTWEREKRATGWYEFACAYADLKWKQASAKYRKDIARALTAATPAMLAETRGRPDDASIRRALIRWGFNTKQRSEPPDEVAEVLAWVARNSEPVSALAEATNARRMLAQATGRLDGRNAAASTARRNRTILANAMDYAVELGLLGTNPIRALKWTVPKVSSQVPAERREPAPGASAAGGSARPTAKRAAARHLLRGHVLRRAPSRGSYQSHGRQRDLAASGPTRR